MKRIVKRTLWAVLALFLVALVGAAIAFGPMTYAAMVGYQIYETVPPKLPDNLGPKAILIFSKTNGFRDDDQIKAGNAAVEAIAKRESWSSFTTENAAVFNPEQLGHFQAVVFDSVSGDVFTPEQRAAFKAWLEQGGGFVGLHGAGGDTKYAWQWYADELIGARFIGHTLGPHIQQATLVIEDQNHPATKGLGASWVRSDEWYSFAASPRAKGYQVLVSIDESTYKPIEHLLPFTTPKSLAMGKDHPMVWTHCVGKGRALYSALGHTASSYTEPKHVELIKGAIAWAAGYEGTGCGSEQTGK